MRDWELRSGDPLTLILASDARLSPVNYFDDHIWELSLRSGDPPALVVTTSYGLRASTMRLFPRFTEAHDSITDPEQFDKPPVITSIYYNYIKVLYSPFSYLDVTAEYWVPDSHSIAGFIQVSNSGQSSRELDIEWVSQLIPNDGKPMVHKEIQAAPVLSGYTNGIYPLVFLTGGPQPGKGSYPSLYIEQNLPAGGSYKFMWVQTARDSEETSFSMARGIAKRNWQAERTAVELANAGSIEIHTGDPDWDITFVLAQNQAFGLLMGPTPQLLQKSFVLARSPDHGYSLLGDGSDYNYLWNGQSPLEAYYLINYLLPGYPEYAAGILENYLHIQDEHGFIDWKPGLGGQRSGLLATPLLASIAWRIYSFSENKNFLKSNFESLIKFFNLWLTPQHDRDEDGIPEWDHELQTGIEDHPLYSHWHKWSKGINISTSESPTLCSFLYRECLSLIEISKTINVLDHVDSLQLIAEKLQSAMEDFWHPDEVNYVDRDRNTHLSKPLHKIGYLNGAGTIEINRNKFDLFRLFLAIQSDDETACKPDIYIYGSSGSGQDRVEHITSEMFKWHMGRATFTGDLVYSQIENIVVDHIGSNNLIEFYMAGYQCQFISGLLPIWAQIPPPSQVEVLVEETICNPKKYWGNYGISTCPQSSEEIDDEICNSVNLPWISLIGEGLTKYGYRDVAAELVTNVMQGIIRTLKKDHSFRRYYHSKLGQGSGERNAVQGLAPLGLFLETLGVRLISSKKIMLEGLNPYPWPVTVKYKGLTVLRQKDKSIVIFPDGQTIEIDDPQPCIVSLDIDDQEAM